MYFIFSVSISDFSNKAIPRTYQSPLVMEKIYLISTLEPSFLIRSSSFLQVINEDNRKSLDEFEFRQNSTPDFQVRSSSV